MLVRRGFFMKFSFVLPIIVTVVGLYLLIRLRFFFIAHPIRTAREFLSALEDREARRSFFLALAGTLGVGNIFGVSAGLMIGGAGSLFWLFISSFFAMIIKYSETLLVFDTGAEQGGTAAVLTRVFSRLGRLISPLYAALTVLLAFFMGASMQAAALTDAAEKSLGLSPIFTALILLFLLLPCLLGGAKKIESITEIIIPLTTIIYIILCFAAIFVNFNRLGDVICYVLDSAFNFRSAVGGGVMFLAVREGFARGILSNEAGVGTSAMAHSRSQRRSPHVAGLFAMCEVVFDSSLLCIFTGLAVLVSVPDISAFDTPMSLVNAAFSSALGAPVSYILTVLIFAFAYSTIICWYYYGMECSRLYFGKISWLYPLLFVAAILTSGLLPPSFLLYFTDLLLLLMSLMTLSAILKKTPRIAELCLSKRKNPE